MSESKRQILHISMVAFAFLLRWLNWWQSALCAVAALLYNLFVLPRVSGRTVFRENEQAKHYSLGILLYPITVLILILIFRGALFIAAGTWAIMAFGDGFATLAGRRFGRTPLPWNSQKTFLGSLTYVVAGGLGAVFFLWFTAPNVHYQVQLGGAQLVVMAFGAALAAALVESLPWRLDDNITAPLVGGGVMWLLYQLPW
jgi:dolichol kinase